MNLTNEQMDALAQLVAARLQQSAPRNVEPQGQPEADNVIQIKPSQVTVLPAPPNDRVSKTLLGAHNHSRNARVDEIVIIMRGEGGITLVKPPDLDPATAAGVIAAGAFYLTAGMV